MTKEVLQNLGFLVRFADQQAKAGLGPGWLQSTGCHLLVPDWAHWATAPTQMPACLSCVLQEATSPAPLGTAAAVGVPSHPLLLQILPGKQFSWDDFTK